MISVSVCSLQDLFNFIYSPFKTCNNRWFTSSKSRITNRILKSSLFSITFMSRVK